MPATFDTARHVVETATETNNGRYLYIFMIPNRAYQTFSEVLVMLRCYFQHCMMVCRTSTFEN